MPTEPAFVPFPKIARLNREIIVTEKLDGTNASIHIDTDGNVRAASRTRWITPEDDNFGFAVWVRDNTEKLRGLGPGSHFGEWWGAGIQRRYGLDHKRFSLFNVSRWEVLNPGETVHGCHVVPVLFHGQMDSARINDSLHLLKSDGSVAAPGFMRPEGIVIFHTAQGHLFKVTCEKDFEHKGKSQCPSVDPKTVAA